MICERDLVFRDFFLVLGNINQHTGNVELEDLKLYIYIF